VKRLAWLWVQVYTSLHCPTALPIPSAVPSANKRRTIRFSAELRNVAGLLCVLRALQGLGGAASYTAISARLADRFPDRLGTVMGLQESFAGESESRLLSVNCGKLPPTIRTFAASESLSTPGLKIRPGVGNRSGIHARAATGRAAVQPGRLPGAVRRDGRGVASHAAAHARRHEGQTSPWRVVTLAVAAPGACVYPSVRTLRTCGQQRCTSQLSPLLDACRARWACEDTHTAQ